MPLTFLARTAIVWTGCILIFFFGIMLIRDERARKIESLPMKLEQFDSLQAQLPEEFRSSAKTVGASYQLFDGARIRFLHYGADSSDPANPLHESIEIILDQKLTLFFYPDSSRDGFWKYDGFESGDYENPYEGELRFEVIDRDLW